MIDEADREMVGGTRESGDLPNPKSLADVMTLSQFADTHLNTALDAWRLGSHSWLARTRCGIRAALAKLLLYRWLHSVPATNECLACRCPHNGAACCLGGSIGCTVPFHLVTAGEEEERV